MEKDPKPYQSGLFVSVKVYMTAKKKNQLAFLTLFQCFSLCKGRKMVLRCVVYGCSNTKDVKK